MIEVIIRPKKEDIVYLSDVAVLRPIFVKEDGKLIGMVVKEDGGWIVRIGGSAAARGYWETREECMSEGNYTYHIEP